MSKLRDAAQQELQELQAQQEQEALETVLSDAYHRRFPECCGRPGSECCGNPNEAWAPEDNKIMDALSPVQRQLSDALRAALAEQTGYKLVPEVPTNEWINNLARRHTGSFEKVPFAEIHQCIAELLESAPEAPQPAKQPLIADEICDSWEFITGHQIQFGPGSEGRPMYLSTDEVIEFARAIERAHGIGEQE